MKIKLYPKELLEAAWKQDKKLYAHGDAAAPPKCLRCGSLLAAHLMVNALSRYADVQICEACGMDEALRDAAHTPLPLAEWDAVKSGHLKKSAEKSTCYLVQTCTFSEVFKHTSVECISFSSFQRYIFGNITVKNIGIFTSITRIIDFCGVKHAGTSCRTLSRR